MCEVLVQFPQTRKRVSSSHSMFAGNLKANTETKQTSKQTGNVEMSEI